MPRRDDRKQVSLTVSAAQHAAFIARAAERGMAPSEYVRWLMEQDIEDWPKDLLEWTAKKKKK